MRMVLATGSCRRGKLTSDRMFLISPRCIAPANNNPVGENKRVVRRFLFLTLRERPLVRVSTKRSFGASSSSSWPVSFQS